jgi:hypothetical protein
VTPAQSSAVAISLRGVPGRSAESRATLLARHGPRLAAFGALVAFGLVPFVVILIRSRGGVLTGATGIFPADQLQYLAWVRDIGGHLLARNNFDVAPSARVFFDPIFGLSGGLVRLGLSPAWAYDAWLPVAAAALLAGYTAYVRRLLPGSGARRAALVVALFATTPAAPLLAWVVGLSPDHYSQLALAVADSTPALQLWGYFPIAIVLALMCVSLLAIERAIDPSRRRRGRSPLAEIGVAAGAAALAGWIHPWQGATLLVIFFGLAATERSRRALAACAVAGLAICIPLAYYWALPHLDAAWAAARVQNNLGGYFGGWVAVALLGPLALPALAGLARRDGSVQERILVLWPLAALSLYWLNPPYAIHTLEGITLPLAVLAVRGCLRLRVRGPAAALLVAAATLPGLAFAGYLLYRTTNERREPYVMASDDARALRAVADSRLPGAVLAPAPLAASVPGVTGRQTWLGHPSWTPGLGLRETEAGRFFGGRMSAAVARRFVRNVGARLAIAPCGSSTAIEHLLGPRLASTRRIGCARVLTLRL